ncbi:helix-turn-helix domain-containing protein [Nocardia sp. NPDC127526]|uniref:helix-turn-helix domain-containing protein n=1 Tax=Nocardia sp. NPDC127526 TaxID=3345393 RepID=UPI00364198ED
MAGSSVSYRTFGRFLRGLRKQAGKSLLAAGLQIEVSPPTVMRLEDGLPSKVTTPQIERLLDFYEVDRESRTEALRLWVEVREQAKAAKLQGNSKGFWRAYADQYFSYFPHYLRLETDANRITTHQLVLVPGLLQTPDYRRAIAKIEDPDLSAVDTERRLELNSRRQAKLDDNNLRLNVLLSEAVLRHQPGGPAVMADQLRWLCQAGQRDNISIRVVPFRSGSHRGLTIQSFTLLEFPHLDSGLTEPPVAYIEGAIGALYHEREDVIDQYREAISSLRAVALTEGDTQRMMLDIAKEYEA